MDLRYGDLEFLDYRAVMEFFGICGLAYAFDFLLIIRDL